MGPLGSAEERSWIQGIGKLSEHRDVRVVCRPEFFEHRWGERGFRAALPRARERLHMDVQAGVHSRDGLRSTASLRDRKALPRGVLLFGYFLLHKPVLSGESWFPRLYMIDLA